MIDARTFAIVAEAARVRIAEGIRAAEAEAGRPLRLDSVEIVLCESGADLGIWLYFGAVPWLVTVPLPCEVDPYEFDETGWCSGIVERLSAPARLH